MRRNLYDNWHHLPSCVKSYFVKKVVIIGTESCGKSTLTKKLAKFYNTNYVHEIGRDYCDKYSNQLTREMFDLIAMEHFLLQKKKSEESNKVLLIDSEATITQYYLHMYFEGEKSQLVEELIKLQDYDLAIFLEPDIKWVDDGLRFAGEESVRKKNNEKLKEMFAGRDIPFVTVEGDYTERFVKAKENIDGLFEK